MSFISELPVIKTVNLYSRLLTAWFTKGIMDKPERNSLGGDEFFYANNRIYTSKGVKKPYFIHELPSEINKGIITDLRMTITRRIEKNVNIVSGKSEECTVNFITVGDNYKMDMADARTRGRIAHWSRQEERVLRGMDRTLTLEEELSSDKHSESTVRMVKSLRVMKELEESKAGFFKTKFIVELNATSDEALEEAEKAITEWSFSQGGIRMKPLFFQANEYFMSYSPLGNDKNPRKSLLRKMHRGDVLPDRIINNMSVLSHGGTLGDKLGVPHGVNVMTRNVFSIDVGSGNDAKNFLLSAQTGQGKSVFMKTTLGYYDLMGYSTVVLDYEGDEYTHLAHLIGANIISISGGSSKYVNTLAIGGITGNDEMDRELMNDAKNMTENVFDIIMKDEDRPFGMNNHQRAIFDYLIDKSYQRVGVDRNKPSTWENSKKCTYYTMYEVLLELARETRNSDVTRFDKASINSMVVTLERYFEKTGGKSDYFKNPISVEEVLTNRHIVFSFGMKGQDESQSDKKSLELRQLFVSYLTMLKANYNRSKNKKTIVVMEELQRYLEQDQSVKIVANFATGGRKRGMVCYFITNNPASLIEGRANDNSTTKDGIKALVDNITMFIIGGQEKQPMEALIRAGGLHDAYGDLMHLVDASRAEGSHPFKNCFFIKYKEQSVIVKAICHPELVKLPIFSTTVTQDSDDSNVELNYGVSDEDINRAIRNMELMEEVDEEYLNDSVSLGRIMDGDDRDV